MDDHSKSQVKRLVAQSPEYAAGYKAGREAGMREAAIDADAATRYGKTAQAHGFSNAPPWSELAEETKQLYRDAILSAIGGGK